jgi:hypothetical protein
MTDHDNTPDNKEEGVQPVQTENPKAELEAAEEHTGRIRQFRSSHPRSFLTSFLLGSILVMGVLVILLLPFALRWGGEKALMRMGASSAAIDSIVIYYTTASIVVTGFEVEGEGGEGASFDTLLVDLAPTALFKKRLLVQSVQLGGLTLDLRHEETGELLVAGLKIPAAGTPATEAGEKGKSPWGLGLDKLAVRDADIHITLPEVNESVTVQKLDLDDFYTWEPDSPGSYALNAGLLGGSVAVTGKAAPFSGEPSGDAEVTVTLMPLGSLAGYVQPSGVSRLDGILDLDTSLELSASGSGRTAAIKGSVELAGFQFAAAPKDSEAAASGTISGMDIAFESTYTDTLAGDGSLTAPPDSMELSATISPTLRGLAASIETADLTMDVAEDNFSVTIQSEVARDNAGARLRGNFSASFIQEALKAVLLREDLPYTCEQRGLDASFSGSWSQGGEDDALSWATRGGMKLASLALTSNGTELLGTGAISLEEISAASDGNIGFKRLGINDISLLARDAGKDEPPSVLSLGGLSIQGVKAAGKERATVDRVAFSGLNAWMLRDEKGTLELQALIGSAAPAGEADRAGTGAAPDEPDSAASTTVAVSDISLSGENRITFRDESVSPPYSIEMSPVQFRALDLDTGALEKWVTVSSQVGIGKYSAINIDGTVRLVNGEPDMNLRVALKGIDLPPVTPYTRRYVGYIMKSGHLDTEADVIMEGGVLDAQAEIRINRIEMDPVKPESEEEAEARLGIPVNTALSLLKDKNDDIHLTLPIEGNIHDPEFDISDVIWTATGGALKKGVSAFYGPLGASIITGGLLPPGTFSLLGKLFSGATALRFEPVAFEPLTRDLTEEHRAYLAGIAEKLKEKPDVRLVLCGMSTADDITAAREEEFQEALAAAQAAAQAATAMGESGETGEREPSGGEETSPGEGSAEAQLLPEGPLTLEQKPLTEEEKESLVELSKQRALAVKDFLTTEGGLEPERLFVCYSDVEKEESELPPRVELTI